jgi:tetraacyldisaccharide 4'-kinase
VKHTARWPRWLWPVSLLYSAVVRAKVVCYRRGIFRARKLPGTVISVGNLTVGGTGKTPVVLAIAERLAAEGKRVAILTRGYRGTTASGPSGVPQSDEVALLRERLKGKVQLGVGANRYASGMVLARHGVDSFVLDDGFQHLKLARNIDVVLVDATDPFGGGMVLPAGRLREPLSALRRASVVVVTRSVEATAPAVETIIRRYTDCPIFYASLRLESVLRVPGLDVELPPQDWPRGRFLAFCAIGNSAAFFGDLRMWGFQTPEQRSFGDHHVYTPAEAAQLEQAALACGAEGLICTEKDVWNLRNVLFAKLPVYCCRISVDLPDRFWSALTVVTGAVHRPNAGGPAR